jgi:hypothetical protein
MNNVDINALGEAMDTTWGRSSTPVVSDRSVKFKFAGDDRVSVTFSMLVNFSSEREMIQTKKACMEESSTVINEYVKSVKGSYKDRTGETLKFKEVSSNDSIEIVSFNVHNPKRTGLLRRVVTYEVST